MMSNNAKVLQSNVNPTNSILTPANRWDHFLARWGYRRMKHRVKPGLYALRNPTPESPVFVTANYTLSFDTLRSSLQGIDGYILVLDTEGVNVWCAAGKGTFGTEELVNRIEKSQLKEKVGHRTLILPQLGAPGIVAHEVKKRTGFKVEYGPVRAKGLPLYLKSHEATPEMRRVRFNLFDRMAVIPVELVAALPAIIVLGIALYFLGGGIWAAAGIVAAILAGAVLFPILLPWLPTHDFSTKGFILGALVAIALFLVKASARGIDILTIRQLGNGLSTLLMWSPVTAFVSLNFTGSTTYTSRSGVRREIYRYIRVMAGCLIAGIILSIVLSFI